MESVTGMKGLSMEATSNFPAYRLEKGMKGLSIEATTNFPAYRLEKGMKGISIQIAWNGGCGKVKHVKKK